jgi:hypothetical protein
MYQATQRYLRIMFTANDKAMIEGLYHAKGWGAKRLVREFPNKPWPLSSLNDLLRKIRLTGTSARQAGSGRPPSVGPDMEQDFESALCSQEDQPRTGLSPRMVLRHHAQDVGSRTTIRRTIKRIGLNCYKRPISGHCVGQSPNENGEEIYPSIPPTTERHDRSRRRTH